MKMKKLIHWIPKIISEGGKLQDLNSYPEDPVFLKIFPLFRNYKKEIIIEKVIFKFGFKKIIIWIITVPHKLSDTT